MKLTDHVEHIRQLIDAAFRNRLGRMGITAAALQPFTSIPAEYREERKRIETIREVLIQETGSVAGAFEKLVEEFTFTLFNRLAALKVMEAHTMHPEIITRRNIHGDRSFAHKHWLEEHSDGRNEEIEGMVRFMEDQLESLSGEIPLFSLQHPYHLLPTAIELNGIITAFNRVETDPQVEPEIWKSDDVLGWLYESYNNYKKAAHKESGNKTEYNKVSIQSQVYTPRWVVKFLVDNSLGKLYLEMYPDSDIKNRYKIANAPKTRTRELKPLTELKFIDPATGSGNFLLYGFDLFYDLYLDQIENYSADYDERKIPELIIEHNLHGVDLDDRAVQLAQLGLYIKGKRKKRNARIEHFNIVSTDFYLPEYSEVKHLFEGEQPLSPELEKIVTDLWVDLQQAYKFGALIRLEEKFSMRLHGLVDRELSGITLFSESTLTSYEQFRDNFFANLQKAVEQNAARQGQTFLNTKTQDAITFLELLTQKYDVAVANPPYTDNADFGPELKEFIEVNYRQPYKFNSNLYTAFIKKSFELTNEDGFIGMIHPLTFMFIKSYEDVRRFIITNAHIDILIDYGLDRVNLFGPGILLDSVWYVLNKKQTDTLGVFIDIKSNQQEKFKKSSLEFAYKNFIENIENERVYQLNQSKLKIIEGWPFIYWISDEFRDKFKVGLLSDFFKVAEGLTTANNYRFLRFFWEIVGDDYNEWPLYAKGGEFNKYYGNVWLRINWKNNGKEIREYPGASVRNSNFYFKNGITFSSMGSRGGSYRILNSNCLFDSGSRSIFPKDERFTLYAIGFLNSKLATYILDSLNPTVNTTQGDVSRIPFVIPSVIQETQVSSLVECNVSIKKLLHSFKLLEIDFKNSPLLYFSNSHIRDRAISFLNEENAQLTLVMLNEAVINEIIYDVYSLNSEDRSKVESKFGKAVGTLPVIPEARSCYLSEIEELSDVLRKYIQSLPCISFEKEMAQALKFEFVSLYQTNNDLEEFCIRHQINPINVWYWFKESRVLPQVRAAEIALEFLAGAFCTILMEDEDGIVPLVGLPGETRLLDRFEQYCFNKGLTSAQIMQLDGLLGRPLNEYIEQYFFRHFSDHLNLFMYLPKTPFIWHLSSGPYQGFESFVIIYKWNRDSLYKLKSSYLSKRTESLHYRLQQIGVSNSAQAQTEREIIRLQLLEIDSFARKIDDLIAQGYDPKLDDGVGKNIAPLQAKGMLKAEVLKSSGKNSQLQKYLNADW